MEAILKLRAPGLLGCALSGAGPSILVFFETGSREVIDLVREEFDKAGQTVEVRYPGIDREGLVVR